MSVISQNNARNVQKRFINFYYTHEGRHEGLYTNNDNYEDATLSSSSIGFWLVDHMPQNSSQSLKYSTPRFASKQRKQGWVHLWLVLGKAIGITGKAILNPSLSSLIMWGSRPFLTVSTADRSVLHSTEVAHFHHSSRKSFGELWTQPHMC
jgi:hypothetical protein